MPETTTIRFTDEDADRIQRLRDRLSAQTIGRPLTNTDVIRHALRILDAQVFGDTPENGSQKKKKKSQD